MDKVLIEVVVPASNKSYDVFITPTSKLRDITALLSSSLSDMSNGKFRADETTVLCDAKTGNILNINLSVYELDIKNGSKLMLI